jgi:hypothetical protein
VLRSVANWWDSVELWITQLAFPVHVLLAIAVLLPLCGGAAILADRVSDLVDELWSRRPSARRGGPGRGEGARTRG